MGRGMLMAVAVSAMVAGGCASSDPADCDSSVDISAPIESVEPAESVEPLVDESDVDDAAAPAELDAPAVSDDDDLNALLAELDDDDIAEVLADLDDDEINELLDELDDAGYDRVLTVLDSVDTHTDTGDEASSGDDESNDDDEPTGDDESPVATTMPDELDPDTAAILTELQENGFCDPADVEDGGVVTAMHFVVNGQVQPPCSGEVDPRLDRAWAAMAEVTPTEMLADISLFAGFEGCDACDTLAFVTTLDEAGEFFLMAVDVQAGDDDPNELALTMQHELSHVFTQVPSTQLDLSVSREDCTTYYNGSGCLREGAYTWKWVQQFWDAEALATIPDEGGPNEEAGEARCVVDAPFTGSYGASDPEEDLAEVFSAYVFDVDVNPALNDKLAFFDEYPEFREIRARAEAAGRWDADYSFDEC